MRYFKFSINLEEQVSKIKKIKMSDAFFQVFYKSGRKTFKNELITNILT